VGEIAYLRKGIKKDLQIYLNNLVEDKQLIKLKVKNEVFYSNGGIVNLLSSSLKKKVVLLNPFDHLIIQRKRLKFFFDFEYLIECYVPEAKRRFGYYVLPILYGHEFIGRIDAKADRKSSTLIVKKVWYEAEFKSSSTFQKEFEKALRTFAQFCGCEQVRM